jgi:hypothetical protein
MLHYNLHYRFDMILPGPGTLESLMSNEGLKTVERHARCTIDYPVAIEYASDLLGIEQWLAEKHIHTPGCTNFQVLSWQPLLGEQRPASIDN